VGNPVFRFTLSHSSVGTKVISEPIGWAKAKLKLERHPEFHSLVEYFEGDFIFYGSDGIVDGGLNFILNVENRFGFNTDLNIQIDISYDDGVDYESVFTGQLDLIALQHLNNNQISVPIIRDNLWSKLIARRNIPVDLSSVVDLDGNPCSPTPHIEINLPSQKVRQIHESISTTSGSKSPESSKLIINGRYYQCSFDKVNVDEISEIYPNPQVDNTELPAGIFIAKYAGSYSFSIQSTAFDYNPAFGQWSGQGPSDFFNFFLNVDGVEFPFTIGDTFASTNISAGRIFYLEMSGVQLAEGSEVRVYGKGSADKTISGSYTGTFNWNGPVVGLTCGFGCTYDIECFLNITADTIYPSSTAQGYLLHDAFAGVVQRICGTNAFYSEVLGGIQTNMRAYAANGCFWFNAITRGLQIRTYSLTDKPMSISFDELWKGSDPIWNLGFGYDVVSGSPVLRLEEKGFFYNHNSSSVTISNIQDIKREYDSSKIFSLIEAGFKEWKSEDIRGLDDVQTVHKYNSPVTKKISGEDKEIGGTLTITSGFIAASIAWEITRRKTIKESQDYKYDDKTFVVSLNTDDVSPDRYEPELNENFISITNLFNSETRYNTRLTPARSVLRWLNVLNGFLQKNVSSVYRFIYGEGNYDMVSTINNDGCRGDSGSSVSEKQNITVTSDYLHYPDLYDTKIDLSWNDYSEIRGLRNCPILQSRTTSSHKQFFIKLLTYEIVAASVEISSWAYNAVPSEMMAIVTPEDLPTNECIDFCEEERITEDGETRITEDGETRILEVGDCSTDDTIGGYIYFYEPAELVNVYFYEPAEDNDVNFFEPEEI
jgi:hypothetical protein